MKRAVYLALAVLAVASCKPQKPWSPYEGKPDSKKQVTDSTIPTAFTKNEQFNADIGDVEQAIYVGGKISQDSRGPNVIVTENEDRRKHVVISSVTLTEPLPESLWADFEVECTRNFMLSPAVLRARIAVDDKSAGSFSVLLGQKAMKNGVSVKVDLLKPFQGQVPDTFLVKVVGDMYLTPEGTQDAAVNPDTATAAAHSQALQGTTIRVTVQRNGQAAPGATPAEPAAAPAEPAAAPSVATPTPETTPPAAP